MLRKTVSIISNGIAKDKLEKQLGLSPEQSEALAPLAVEIKRVWDNTAQERRMLQASVENIVSKSQPLKNALITSLQNDQVKSAIEEIIGYKIMQGIELLITSSHHSEEQE